MTQIQIGKYFGVFNEITWEGAFYTIEHNGVVGNVPEKIADAMSGIIRNELTS